MGTGTLNIDESRQLQLITQYYKSQGDDDYGLNLGKGFAIRGTSTPFVSNGLNSDRIPGTERHLISLQYSDSAFLGQELVGQVYYRDESLRFYPFPTVNANKQVTAFSSSQQDTDQYGMKLTLNSKPMDGWQITWGLDADHERFTSNQMFFDLAQQALPEAEQEDLHHRAIRRMTSPTWRPSCNQAMTSIISLPSTVAYAISTLKTRLMISSATRSNGRLPPEGYIRRRHSWRLSRLRQLPVQRRSADASPNASRHGSTSPRAWSCRTRVNTMVAASMVLQ